MVLPQLTLSSSWPFFARYMATFSLVLDKSRLAWNWRREREEGGKKIWCSPSHDRQVNPSFPQCSASATRGPCSSHANRVTRELYNLTNFLTVSWLTINSCRFSRSLVQSVTLFIMWGRRRGGEFYNSRTSVGGRGVRWGGGYGPPDRLTTTRRRRGTRMSQLTTQRWNKEDRGRKME